MHLAENTVSDHSIIACDVKTHANSMSNVDTGVSEPKHDESARDTCHRANNTGNNQPLKRYRKGQLPSTFLTDVEQIRNCEYIIDQLLEDNMNQDIIDGIYHNFTEVYHKELGSRLKKLDQTPRAK